MRQRSEDRQFVEVVPEVAAYYSATLDLYLEYIGTTFQGGQVRTRRGVLSSQASNVFMSRGMALDTVARVIDLGCGVGGPAIDLASRHPELSIDGVTITADQAKVAARLVRDAGLDERVRVHLADYHSLPFSGETFDLAIILESIGYSYSLGALLSEVRRVLRGGGRIYIKDTFLQEETLTKSGREALAAFSHVFKYRPFKVSRVVREMRREGFLEIDVSDISAEISTDRFVAAMFLDWPRCKIYSPFGEAHRGFPLEPRAPVRFAKIEASLP